jgi:hypothetical protein
MKGLIPFYSVKSAPLMSCQALRPGGNNVISVFVSPIQRIDSNHVEAIRFALFSLSITNLIQ